MNRSEELDLIEEAIKRQQWRPPAEDLRKLSDEPEARSYRYGRISRLHALLNRDEPFARQREEKYREMGLI